MADIRSQVAKDAEHVSFGDPDFFNGPTHALKLARALHTEFPDVTFDATIKVQHLIDHAELLPELKRCGCLYVTAAVEAVDDRILAYLDKNIPPRISTARWRYFAEWASLSRRPSLPSRRDTSAWVKIGHGVLLPFVTSSHQGQMWIGRPVPLPLHIGVMPSRSASLARER